MPSPTDVRNDWTTAPGSGTRYVETPLNWTPSCQNSTIAIPARTGASAESATPKTPPCRFGRGGDALTGIRDEPCATAGSRAALFATFPERELDAMRMAIRTTSLGDCG